MDAAFKKYSHGWGKYFLRLSDFPGRKSEFSIL
jgi:hypothetical protein